MKRKDEVPADQQHFRYWVELRDLRDGATRDLPMTCVRKILLVPKVKEEDTPSRLEIHVQDGTRTWVAADLNDLSAQLRGQYPDGAFERTLSRERDLAAEQRYRAAMDELIRILARAVVNDLFAREEGG